MLKNRVLQFPARQNPFRAVATRPLPRKAILRQRHLLVVHRHTQRNLSSARPRTIPYVSPSSWRPSLFQRFRTVRKYSEKPSPSAPHPQGNKEAQSASQRFKELSRKYGWAAVGVYFGLSVLDFPFCFIAVRLVGPERIGEVEHAIVDGFWSLVAMVNPNMGPEKKSAVEDAGARESTQGEIAVHQPQENASIWTQLLLAYGVHKSLIFFRVPLAAAVTPKVVKTLRGWGWNIGKAAARA